MPLMLGCIADDYTGATDLSSALTESGLRVVQLFGRPGPSAAPPDPGQTDAVVIALKIRTAPAADAVADALAALDWLRRGALDRVLFKYCSTFDSTPAGNIGPVHDALQGELGVPQSISTPATPENGRTVYLGHLFVGNQLLSESSMRDHPLTPMRDPLLTRVLAAQSRADVRLLPLSVVRAGADAIHAHLAELRRLARGPQVVVCDAIDDNDLRVLAAASRSLPLLSGAAGLGRAVAATVRAHAVRTRLPAHMVSAGQGPTAVLAGSCSSATLGQVEHMAARYPTYRLDAEQLARYPRVVEDALAWAGHHLATSPVLLAASQPPEQVARAQRHLGRSRAAELVETALGRLAVGLRRLGVRKLIVAGGETSAAVVNALGIREVHVGPALAPGVPWVYSDDGEPMLLALKSGNFGEPDFFLDAAAPGAVQLTEPNRRASR